MTNHLLIDREGQAAIWESQIRAQGGDVAFHTWQDAIRPSTDGAATLNHYANVACLSILNSGQAPNFVLFLKNIPGHFSYCLVLGLGKAATSDISFWEI